MASIRVVVTLVMVLTLYFAAPVAAQSAIGPICLQPALAGQEPSSVLEIFALPMGGVFIQQFLLSAVSGTLPFSGAASRDGQAVEFTLIAALPVGGVGAAGTFSGQLDLAAGTGVGACSTIASAVMDPQCGTATPITYALVPCSCPVCGAP